MYFKKILSKACFTSIVLSQDGRARLLQVRPCVSDANFVGIRTFRSILAAAVQ